MKFETNVKAGNDVVEFEFDIAKGNSKRCFYKDANTINYSAHNVDGINRNKLLRRFKKMNVVRNNNHLFGKKDSIINNVMVEFDNWKLQNASELEKETSTVKSKSGSKKPATIKSKPVSKKPSNNNDGKPISITCDAWNGFNTSIYYYDEETKERKNTSISAVDYNEFMGKIDSFLADEFINDRKRRIPNNYEYKSYVFNEKAEEKRGEIMKLTDRINKSKSERKVVEFNRGPKKVEIKFSKSRDCFYFTYNYVYTNKDGDNCLGDYTLTNKNYEDIIFKVNKFIHEEHYTDRCNYRPNNYNYVGYKSHEKALEECMEYRNSEEYKLRDSNESVDVNNECAVAMDNSYLFDKEYLRLPVKIQDRVKETGGLYLEIVDLKDNYSNYHIVPYTTCINLYKRAVFNDDNELAKEYVELACSNDNVVQLPNKLHNELHKRASNIFTNICFNNDGVFVGKSDIPSYLVEMVLIFTDLCREYNDCFDDLDSVLMSFVIKTMAQLNEYVDLSVYYDLMDMHLVDYKESSTLYTNVENVFGLIKTNCL